MRWLASIRIWAAAVLAAATAVLVAFLRGRNAGKSEQEAEQIKDAMDRVEKGREAVRDGRDDDPADRLRRNDGRW